MVFDYKQEYFKYKKLYFAGIGELAKRPVARASLNLLLFLVTCSFMAYFALKPTLVTIASLLGEIKVKKEVDGKLGQKITALNQVQIIFTKAEELLPLVDKALPVQAEFSKFEKELEFLLFKNNVILVDVRFEGFNLFGTPPQKDKKDKQAKQQQQQQEKALPFTLTFAGSYQDLKNFINELENLDRFVTIDKISFSSETKVTGTELQVTLSGRVYYFAGEQPLK